MQQSCPIFCIKFQRELITIRSLQNTLKNPPVRHPFYRYAQFNLRFLAPDGTETRQSVRYTGEEIAVRREAAVE